MMELTRNEVLELVTDFLVGAKTVTKLHVLAYNPCHHDALQKEIFAVYERLSEAHVWGINRNTGARLALWASTILRPSELFWYGTNREFGVFLHAVGKHEAYGGYYTWAWNEAKKHRAVESFVDGARWVEFMKLAE